MTDPAKPDPANASPAMPEPAERCERCGKPEGFCVCDRIAPLSVRTRVVIAQHPREQDRELGTAPLVRTLLPKACEVRVGLSWAGLAWCVDDGGADPARWAVLYPHSLRKPLDKALLARPHVLVDRHGDPLEGTRLDGVIVLDGTWSQAKALWWRNPWFLKLPRLLLHPKEPSIYGRLRREPRRDALSTLESVAEALVANGEPAAVRDEMRKAFRTMVQRARDHLKAQGRSEPEAVPEE